MIVASFKFQIRADENINLIIVDKHQLYFKNQSIRLSNDEIQTLQTISFEWEDVDDLMLIQVLKKIIPQWSHLEVRLLK